MGQVLTFKSASCDNNLFAVKTGGSPGYAFLFHKENKQSVGKHSFVFAVLARDGPSPSPV